MNHPIVTTNINWPEWPIYGCNSCRPVNYYDYLRRQFSGQGRLRSIPLLASSELI